MGFQDFLPCTLLTFFGLRSTAIVFVQSKNIYDISIMEKFEAIIFDCDGVLVNSEEILQGVELALLGEHGLDYDLEEYSRRFLGVSNKTLLTE